MRLTLKRMDTQKFELSPFAGYHPHQKIEYPCPSSAHRPRFEKMVSLRAFIEILSKILPARAFSFTQSKLI